MVGRVVSRDALAGRGARRRAGAAVRRALRARRALTAKVRVTVTDAAGNQTIAGRSVRLTG
jgi:hypothetical protein